MQTQSSWRGMFTELLLPRKRDVELLLLGIFFLTVPFMVNDPNQPFLPPPLGGKIQISEIVFIVLVTAWAWRSLKEHRPIVRTPLDLPIICFLAASWLSLVNAEDFPKAAIEGLGLIYLAGIFWITFQILSHKGELGTFIRWWMLVTGLLLLISITAGVLAYGFGIDSPFVYFGRDMPIFGRSWRVKGPFQPTSKLLSTYLLLWAGVNLSWALTAKGRLRRVLWWFFAASTGTIILTISRGIVAYGLTCLVVWIFAEGSYRTRWISWGLGVIVVTGFLLNLGVSTFHPLQLVIHHGHDPSIQARSAHYYSTDPERGAQVINIKFAFAPDNYFVLKWAAFRMWQSHLVLGNGLDQFGLIFQQMIRRGEVKTTDRNFETAQSQPFNTLAETGLLGLGALIFLFFQLLRVCRGARRSALPIDRAWALGFMGSFIGVIYASLDLDVVNFRFLWLIMGLAAVHGQMHAGSISLKTGNRT